MISKEENIRISKLLSYVLRHNPGHIGIQLDENGWVSVDVILRQLNLQGEKVNWNILKEVVDTNSKKRFKLNEDFTMIRASQGHSIEIDLNYELKEPPGILFHGTVEKNLASIKEGGLQKMNRQHVHLSSDQETAYKVAQRHGKPVVLVVRALNLFERGHSFYISDNGVWLTDHVPAEYIEFQLD
jgi:putative RNA 2'-phosphotransferase